MKSRYNPVLIAIIAIGLIVSLWLNYQRHEIEQRNDTVEMAMEETKLTEPLAEQTRPRTLEEIIGQENGRSYKSGSV